MEKSTLAQRSPRRLVSVGTALLIVLGVGILGVKLLLFSSAAPEGVTLSGNQFLVDGQPFIPHGFNSVALLYSASCTTEQAAYNNFNTTELATAKNTWNANMVRFQVSQPVLAGPNGVAYAEQIQKSVTIARNDGFIVDISMQDQALACGPSEPLPSQETETAWATLLNNTSLSSDPSIMFELFNEPENTPTTTATTDPQEETWVDWLNGGRQIQPTTGESWTTYTPVGHQALVNYVRNTLHVTNVLIADGANFAGSLAGVPILNDPGSSYQIAYGVHPYFYTDGPSGWGPRWGYLTSTQAVIATEWNYKATQCGSASETMAPQFLNYMRDCVNVGVLGQSLDIFSGELMADTALDPTQCGTASQGGGYDFLHDYMDTFPTSTIQPTTVALTTPVNDATISGTVTIAATASPATGDSIQNVAFELTGSTSTTLTTDTASPYTYSWDTTTVPNGTYTLTAIATDSSGNTAQNSATVTIDNTPPAQITSPTGLTSPAQTTTSISLTWNASQDNLYPSSQLTYSITRTGGGMTVTLGPVHGTTASTVSYTDTGLKPGTTYSYSVIASDPVGTTSNASTVFTQATETTCPAPAAPGNFSGTASSATSVNLSWNPVTPAPDCTINHYVISRSGVPLAESIGTSYTDNTASAYTTYTYSVVAVTADNVAGASSNTTVTTPKPPDPGPTAPTNLSATPVSGTQINLAWTASTDSVAGIKQYNILRNGVQIGTATATSNPSFGDSGLSSHTTYSYQVVAVSGGGKTAASTIVAAMTFDTTPPSVPSSLASPSQTVNSITLTWAAATDPVYSPSTLTYSVYRNGALVGATAKGVTTLTDTGLAAGTTYSYTVTASDPAGNTSGTSAAFTQATAKLRCSKPPAPSSLIAKVTSAVSVNLSWNAVSLSAPSGCKIKHYVVERDGATIATPTTINYSDTSVAANTKYSYNILAVATGNVKGALSESVTVTTPKVADTSAPNSATKLVAVTVNSSQIDLSWAAGSDPQSGIKQYKVLRDNVLVATVASNSQSFGDTGLKSDTMYTYKLVTVNGAGLTATSASVKATTGDIPGLPLSGVGPTVTSKF